MYVSGTGLTITQHAVKRWQERYREDVLSCDVLFDLEGYLGKALKSIDKPMYELFGENRIKYANVVFILQNRMVVTCWTES